MSGPVNGIDAIWQALIEIMTGNFAVRLPVSGDAHDRLDSINAAINIAAEELGIKDAQQRSAKAYVDNILASMTDSVIVCEPGGTIRTVNGACCEIMGYAAAELIGQSITSLLDDGISPNPCLESLIRDGGEAVRDLELRFRTKDHRPIPMAINGSVMRKAVGELEAVVIVARDMREMRRLLVKATEAEAARQKSEELERAYHDLERTHQELRGIQLQLLQSEKLKALGELAASVGHELNQPLNVIKIVAQSMERDIERGRVEASRLKGDVADILDQVQKMAHIVDHMRVFARHPDAAAEDNVDVNESVRDALTFFRAQLETHGIALRLELDPEIPKVTGDSVRIEQVVMNLVANARDALHGHKPDDAQILVYTSTAQRITADGQSDAVLLRVSDNGPGVPAELSERIFEPFFTTKAPGRGTGLGLAISKSIVEQHAGQLSIDQTLEVGCAFEVLLPIRRAQASANDSASEASDKMQQSDHT